MTNESQRIPRGESYIEPSALVWQKSSYSQAQGNNCVEVARPAGLVAVRDSKLPDEPPLLLGRVQWQDFVGAVKADRFAR
ncbi:hypothetical protein Sru01_17160 [Sphaerisporangium rufum]|uniref:DUF397 domain-containing protein n=1 Tax=Sphaerisporangium rufum TaxID=1381558 RepID=A0A919QYW9_9ACTN|nr:DUF397 domain-containing protein [Sphaerisporangium rufum]GII76734.1 hypothetical protein Sru01_17160 [Sphaerisporangium rufum]